MPRWWAAQLVLGLLVPPLLIPHISGTRLPWFLLGHTIGYERVVGVLWSETTTALRQSLLLLIVWAHFCYGIHYWLRVQRWYSSVQPVFFAAGLLIPSLALAGFAAGGNEVWARIEGAGRMQVFYPELGLMTGADRARLLAWRQGLELAFWALLAATLLARWLRTLLGGTYQLRHSSRPRITPPRRHSPGRVLTARIGRTILERCATPGCRTPRCAADARAARPAASGWSR